jgi:hypothetical protein
MKVKPIKFKEKKKKISSWPWSKQKLLKQNSNVNFLKSDKLNLIKSKDLGINK